MKELSIKDHDKMTEHELRTEVLLLRAKINRLESKPKVTKKDIFDFHINLMTISEDGYDNISEDLWKRERRYIEYWLKSKGLEIEK